MHSNNTYMPPDPLIIEAGKRKKGYWAELFAYRELFLFLAWRDILVRYKQTAIGILWSVIRPTLTMIVFTLIFGKIAQLPTEGAAPYALMVLAALLPWQLFTTAVQSSSDSLINNASLVSSIYFPRLLAPLSTIAAASIDFLITFAVFMLLLFYYRFVPGWRILIMPFFVLLTLLLSIGIGLFISALNVFYRDFKYIIPFALQIGLYISPIGFSSSIIPDKWRFIYSLNPFVCIIDGFRWSLLGQDNAFYLPELATSLIVIAILLGLGIKTFRKMETTFADKI